MSEIQYELINATEQLEKAINIAKLRKECPTVKKIFEKYRSNIPKGREKRCQENLNKTWREIAEQQAKDDGMATTGEEFEAFYEDICDERDKKVKAIYENAEIWTRRKPEALLVTLEQTFGRFRTSINRLIEENKESRSSITKVTQDTIENLYFGYPIDLPIECRLLYAYATENLNSEHGEMASFGPIAIRFDKSKVTQRSTKLMGGIVKTDDRNGRAVPYDETDRACCPIELSQDLHNGKIKRSSDILPWSEVHLHEGTTIDDVAEVLFTTDAPIDEDIKNKLKKLLDEYKFYWRDLSD